MQDARYWILDVKGFRRMGFGYETNIHYYNDRPEVRELWTFL
jgi:hypothetical protein